jgi:hypothetical protein
MRLPNRRKFGYLYFVVLAAQEVNQVLIVRVAQGVGHHQDWEAHEIAAATSNPSPFIPAMLRPEMM